MPSTTLQPNDESHTDDDWPPTGGTRVEVVTDDNDLSYILEVTPETDVITYEYEAVPSGAMTHGVSAYIKATKLNDWDCQVQAVLKIDGESKGAVLSGQIAQYPAFTEEVLNRAEWDGPWTEAQMNGARVELCYVGKVNVSAIISKTNMPIDYAVGGRTTVIPGRPAVVPVVGQVVG